MMFENKVGIVTGAGSGMGRAAAIRLAQDGAKLGLFDISENGLEETRRLILAATPDAELLLKTVDVSREEEVKAAIEEVAARFGKLNIAFNNAGVFCAEKSAAFDTQKWERALRINFFGMFYCQKYEIIEMLKNDEPSSMVFTSSVGGLIGTPGGAAYNCSKAAIIALAKAITCDYVAQGIRANAICPGQIETPMFLGIMDDVVGEEAKAREKFLRKQNPQRRLGKPEEIANVVAWLLSEESSYISGCALPVDGGHMCTNIAYWLDDFVRDFEA